MKRGERGFSLIELLIVVTIILIIAAIAIPSFLRAKIQANEASAVASVRRISTAEVQFFVQYGIGYAPLLNLGGAGPCVPSTATACLLDDLLATGAKSGYALTSPTPGALGTALAPNNNFSISAVPMAVGLSGQRSFCMDQTAVIRFDSTGAPPPNPCDNGGLSAIQ